ncbi:MAG: hypothetical protein ACLRRT_07420 [Ruthenibacterium lactatiformans]
MQCHRTAASVQARERCHRRGLAPLCAMPVTSPACSATPAWATPPFWALMGQTLATGEISRVLGAAATPRAK